MSLATTSAAAQAHVYPDSDGQPMAENTVQFRWIVTIKEGLDALFRDDPQVFVAGDLFWYPVEGHPEIRTAPDVLVVVGRPKRDRGSYLQWEEAGVAPQVVFEIQSPSNRFGEMLRKYRFFEEHGVEEYYLYDPDHNRLEGWRRVEGTLRDIDQMNGWVSPRLGIRFEWADAGLRLLRPDGRPLETYQEVEQRADAERLRAEAERQRAERLAAQLRSLGVDPEAI